MEVYPLTSDNYPWIMMLEISYLSSVLFKSGTGRRGNKGSK